MKAPKMVTEQKAKMSEILKAMEADARNAQNAEGIDLEFEPELEKIISNFNAAAEVEGLPEVQLVSRAQYKAMGL